MCVFEGKKVSHRRNVWRKGEDSSGVLTSHGAFLFIEWCADPPLTKRILLCELSIGAKAIRFIKTNKHTRNKTQNR